MAAASGARHQRSLMLSSCIGYVVDPRRSNLVNVAAKLALLALATVVEPTQARQLLITTWSAP